MGEPKALAVEFDGFEDVNHAGMHLFIPWHCWQVLIEEFFVGPWLEGHGRDVFHCLQSSLS